MLLNMKKSMFLMAVTTIIIVFLLPSNAYAQNDSGSCGPSSTWVYEPASGTLTINGTGSVTDYSSFNKYQNSVKVLKIGQGITKLEAYNSYEGGFKKYTSLHTVILPDSLTEIGTYTFRDCTSLKSITIPKNVTEANLAFFCSGLTSITFAEGLKEVPPAICENCPDLQTITFASTIQSIGYSAFEACKSLSRVNFPISLKKIGDFSFRGCTSLKTITIPKNVTEAGLAFYGSGITSIIFEKGCKIIPHAICQYCPNLQSVTIPETVTEIEFSAFELCSSLTTITIPASVKKIGQNAFNKSGLKTIKAISDSFANKYANKNGYAFSSIGKPAPIKGSTYKVKTKNLKFKVTNASIYGSGTVSVSGLIKPASSVTIPKTVNINGYTYKITAIEKKAFYKQSRLKKITIKSTTINKIGSKAFTNIYKKAVINVPKAKKTAYKKLLKKCGISKTISIK
ncbi:MAG: leucine-rich repeat domain-containing protein [Lachnospiraceae bacterium]|nr:leucine-rich repeat domain-containing protein [Lachnospiraceae bacterium]